MPLHMIGVNIQHFGQDIEIFWNKVQYRLSLHLDELDTDQDPDRQVLDVYPDPANDADPTGIRIHNTTPVSTPAFRMEIQGFKSRHGIAGLTHR